MEPRRRDIDADGLSPTSSGSGRAIVIGPYRRHVPARQIASHGPQNERAPAARLEEAVGLARAIDLEVVQSGIVPINQVRPATYMGTGKVDEIAGLVKSLEAGIVVVDGSLSPVQQRNLEKAWGAKVLDRTGLILEIFGRRAHTKEGALQVEHAHLTYQRSRLVKSWTHLERQRGGFGFLGGPGESQLEIDRRLIGERIQRIETELEKVKKRRKLHRDSRARVPYPIAALVGYTNAGKSTLFNRMTSASVLQADMLFATLDPTLAGRGLAGRHEDHPVRYRGLHLRPADHAGGRLPRHAGGGHRSRTSSCTCATSRTRTPRRNPTTSRRSWARSASTRTKRNASSRCGTRSTGSMPTAASGCKILPSGGPRGGGRCWCRR